MTGVQRLQEMVKGQDDAALNEIVNYLITRKDMEKYYLIENKTIDIMCKFIQDKARIHSKNGWNFITNEVVFSWAIMYFSLPDEFLKIKTIKETTATKNNISNKNNIISLEDSKQKIEQKKEIEQLNLFGGTEND